MKWHKRSAPGMIHHKRKGGESKLWRDHDDEPIYRTWETLCGIQADMSEIARRLGGLDVACDACILLRFEEKSNE